METSKSYQKQNISQKHQSKRSISQNINQKNQSKTSETSTKCEINSATHKSKYGNLYCNLYLADFKTKQEDNIAKRLRKLVQTYRQRLFTGKIGKL